MLNLVVVKQGDAEIEGLTDTQVPVRLGPKRANKIRKLFALSKEDDVRKYVIRRKFTKKNGKEVTKAPKIQRIDHAHHAPAQARHEAQEAGPGGQGQEGRGGVPPRPDAAHPGRARVAALGRVEAPVVAALQGRGDGVGLGLLTNLDQFAFR